MLRRGELMTIRPGTLADVPALVTLARHFVASYGAAGPENPAQLETLATHLVSTPTTTVLVADAGAGHLVGMIGLVAYAHHVSGVPTVGEVAWWVDPDARGCGVALLQRAERWAAEQGASQIQLIAPNDRVGRLYQRRGYTPIEVSYQRPLTVADTGLRVYDDVLPDLGAYRAQTLAGRFADVETSPGCVFHGINQDTDGTLASWVTARYPQLEPTITFVRKSPAGQAEPNYIHTDTDMGEWTGILYLTAAPAPGDGTTFWRKQDTGAIRSTVTNGSPEQLAEWLAWRDPARWVPWHQVAAVPNRLVLFPAPYYHSRSLLENYGEGDTARLIQVIFGRGTLP
jgi:GNAT superfamily N-acetyltransferase